MYQMYLLLISAMGKEHVQNDNGQLVLPYDQSDVLFSFYGVGVHSPVKTHFSCMLEEGFDKGWSTFSECEKITPDFHLVILCLRSKQKASMALKP